MRRSRTGVVWGGAAIVGLLMGMLDFMTNLANTAVVASMLSVPYINPPPKNTAEKQVPTSPVALFYQVEWGAGEPHDIDLYVQCKTTLPGGDVVTRTVNYRQLLDDWLRLSIDDQGRPTTLNVEKVESISNVLRVPPNTVCVANVHLYNSKGGKLPVSGTMIAINQKDSSTNEETIGVVAFSLEDPGQEKTIIIARWDANGVLQKELTEIYPAVKTILIATAPRAFFEEAPNE